LIAVSWTVEPVGHEQQNGQRQIGDSQLAQSGHLQTHAKLYGIGHLITLAPYNKREQKTTLNKPIPAMFITFEGPEGCGKTTQIEKLKAWFAGKGQPCLTLREPGGTHAGERIRAILKDGQSSLTPMSELLLFLAARAQITQTVIRPALERGECVICDRFTDSTVVYQGAMRSLGWAFCQEQNLAATGGLRPDLTFLLMIPLSVIRERVISRGQGDRFDLMGEEHHQMVIDGYSKIAEQNPDRVKILDGTLSPEAIHTEIISCLSRRN